jgi:hypothetical protein
MGVKLSEIRWESVGKIAAGLLLAVAIVISVPSLLSSDQPEPLPPDVGLPQAATPVAVPPPPPPPKPKPKRKRTPARKPKHDRPVEPPKEEETTPAPAGPIVAALPPPPGTYEDFGFERP